MEEESSNNMFGQLATRYLITLAQEQLGFRIPELASIASLFGKNVQDIWDKTFILFRDDPDNSHGSSNFFDESNTPFIVLRNVHERDVLNLMSRSVFAKQAYEIWGHGATYSELKKSISVYPGILKELYLRSDSSFCIRVKAYGRKIPMKEQVEKINDLEDTVPFKGKVDLMSPTNEFHLIEDYGFHKGKKLLKPHYVYFGRLIGEGQRDLIQSYSVKKRKFIGNTSMEAGLSFIMSNLGKVKPGDYICDPFVGTGSLLIAAAHYGGYVTGGDIDYNILHARGKSSRVGAGYRQQDETIRNSLQQYGLESKYVDVIRHDAARHPWCHSDIRNSQIFDAIITDPPYGIRESCRKVGTDKESIPDTSLYDVHHPEQTAYHLDHVFADLLNFASRTLFPGGRLVFWIPIYRPEYCEDQLPSHPNLRLVYNCEQPLKKETSRRLIVMERYERPNDIDSKSARTTLYKGHNAFRDKYFKVNNE